ncbi:MAG: TRAP transporter small permease [Alphaproteobacteria bacterium]
MDRFETAFASLVTALGVLVALSIGVITIAMTLDWLLRVTEIGGIKWLRDVIEYSLYAGVFLAAPWVLRNRAHVSVDLVLSALSRRRADMLNRALNVLGLLICVALGWFGLELTIQMFQEKSIARKTIAIDRWILQAVFVFTMALLAIEYILRLVRSRSDMPQDRA